jgi:hypothetical protein
MEELHMRCSGCGAKFTLAQGSKERGFHGFGYWGANFEGWLDSHWEHVGPSTPLREAFTLEDGESIKRHEEGA